MAEEVKLRQVWGMVSATDITDSYGDVIPYEELVAWRDQFMTDFAAKKTFININHNPEVAKFSKQDVGIPISIDIKDIAGVGVMFMGVQLTDQETAEYGDANGWEGFSVGIERPVKFVEENGKRVLRGNKLTEISVLAGLTKEGKTMAPANPLAQIIATKSKEYGMDTKTLLTSLGNSFLKMAGEQKADTPPANPPANPPAQKAEDTPPAEPKAELTEEVVKGWITEALQPIIAELQAMKDGMAASTQAAKAESEKAVKAAEDAVKAITAKMDASVTEIGNALKSTAKPNPAGDQGDGTRPVRKKSAIEERAEAIKTKMNLS